MRDARRPHPVAAGHLAHVMRRGFALDRGTRGEDHLLDPALGHQTLEPIETDGRGPDAIERRQTPHENEVAPLISRPLLDRLDVRRRLDDAQERGIAPRVIADPADRDIAEIAAALAVPHPRDGRRQGPRQTFAPLPVTLQEVEGHALGGLGSHPRQAAQGPDQFIDEGAIAVRLADAAA